MATRGGEGAAQRHSVSVCEHMPPDGAPVMVEEDATTVTELLFVCLISKGRKVIVCLLVGEEENHRSSLWIRPDVDMHTGKKATCQLRGHWSQ